MNEVKITYPVRRSMRIMMVMVLYEQELFNQKISMKDIFESDKFHELFNYKKLLTKHKDEVYKEQLSIMSVIEKNYDIFKKIIIQYIRDDWSWNRINPVARAILLCASAELWKHDVALIANEYVEISKDLIPDNETYKFINIIIERIGKQYNEFKNSKRN